MLGMDELFNENKTIIERSRKLIKYFIQPFQVAEIFKK
jgi:F0F1-type ATP synthase beta subunit